MMVWQHYWHFVVTICISQFKQCMHKAEEIMVIMLPRCMHRYKGASMVLDSHTNTIHTCQTSWLICGMLTRISQKVSLMFYFAIRKTPNRCFAFLWHLLRPLDLYTMMTATIATTHHKNFDYHVRRQQHDVDEEQGPGQLSLPWPPPGYNAATSGITYNDDDGGTLTAAIYHRQPQSLTRPSPITSRQDHLLAGLATVTATISRTTTAIMIVMYDDDNMISMTISMMTTTITVLIIRVVIIPNAKRPLASISE